MADTRVKVQLLGGAGDGINLDHDAPPECMWVRDMGVTSPPPAGTAVTEVDGAWFAMLDHGNVAVYDVTGWSRYVRTHGYTSDGRLIYLIHNNPKEPA